MSVGVVSMNKLGADPTLTPEYRGLTDAQNVSGWNWPPGLDKYKTNVTQADEDYWDEHRAAPKLFFFFSSRRRHTRFDCDWSSDVCSSDLDSTCAGRAARPVSSSRRAGT